MRPSRRIPARLFARVLTMYPPAYRAEYGEELQAVFGLAADEAARRGWPPVVLMTLRELRDLPGAIVSQHRREIRRRTMSAKRVPRFRFEPGSGREAVAALAPFLLAVLTCSLSLFTGIPQWLEAMVALPLMGLIVGLVVIAVKEGFPRWFLPYLGLALLMPVVFVVFNVLPGLSGVLAVTADQWLLSLMIGHGLIWICLLLVGLMILMIAGLLPPLRPLSSRLRGDWTLLSFTLYGVALPAVLIAFDGYGGDEPYIIAAMLLLAAGVWLYLRSARPRRRILALATGLTSAMIVVTAGKAILYSSPGWSRPRASTWQIEAVDTAIMGLWLVGVVCLPALLQLSPRVKDRSLVG